MNELHIDKTHWKRTKIGDLLYKTEYNDKENASKQYSKFIKMEHLDANSLNIHRWGDSSVEDIPPTFYKIFKKGQILYPTRNPQLRRAALASFDGICGEKTLTLSLIEGCEGYIPFIAHVFHSSKFIEYATNARIGSTNPHIRWRDVADYEFLLPPKAEQKRLAELLWAADEVVEKEKREMEKLGLFRQSKLKDIFKSANNHTRLKDLPIEEINGLWKTDDPDSIDVSVIRSTEFSDYGTICFDKLEPMPVKISQYKTRKLLPSDIIVERSGGGPDQPVGRVCYFEQSEGEYSFSNFTSCIRVANSDVVLPKYLFYFLEYYWEMGGTDRIQNQTTGIRNLDYELYKMIKVPMLSIEGQKQAINVIDQIQQSIFASKAQIEQSQQIKQELINKIF